MYNWRKVCTVLTVVVLLAVILLSQFGSPLTRLQMKRQVAGARLYCGAIGRSADCI